MKKYRSLIFGFICLLIAGIIFAFSAADASSSADTSEGFMTFLFHIILPGFQNKSPEEQAALLESLHHFVRKAGHFTEYAAFGFFLNAYTACPFSWRQTDGRLKAFIQKRPVLLALCVAGVYALSDEFHQAFVPGRGPALSDAFLDFCGACFGTFVFLAFSAVLHRISEKKRCANGNSTIARKKKK